MPVEKLKAEVVARCERVRVALDVGLDDAAASLALRELGGTWMSVIRNPRVFASVSAGLPAGTALALGADGEVPFEDGQFEVVVLDGTQLSVPLVKEVHRVMKPAGLLFFEVPAGEDAATGTFTPSRLYHEFLKYGFDVEGIRRSAWWLFRRSGRRLTVCARKKTWKEHRAFRPLA